MVVGLVVIIIIIIVETVRLMKVILKRQLGFLGHVVRKSAFNRQNKRHLSNRKKKNKNLDSNSMQAQMRYLL